MKLSHIFISFMILLITPLSLFASELKVFNNQLTATEKAKLNRGEIIIRNIDKAKYISLLPVSPTSEKCINIIKDLNPNYLAEVIQVFPYEQNKNLPQMLEKALSDVENFKKIPYYSVRNKTWYDLFSEVKITKQTENTENTDVYKKTVNTDIKMNPFEPFSIAWSVEEKEDEIFFVAENTTKVTYNGFKCVSPSNMKWVICMFKSDDSLILYGAGAVSGASIFFLRDRIENSFIGRVTSFCNYIYGKLIEK